MIRASQTFATDLATESDIFRYMSIGFSSDQHENVCTEHCAFFTSLLKFCISASYLPDDTKVKRRYMGRRSHS